METKITHVGMDVHKQHISVAILLPGNRKQEPLSWPIPNEPGAIKRFIRKLKSVAQGTIEACYEAGPCGYPLLRQLQAAGIHCVVIAPSLIPHMPGDRVKTDRRDARKLAEYLRSGTLTEVVVPSEEEEAVRDLVRCREDAVKDLQRERHRLSKFLLRKGLCYPRQQWTKGHAIWLRGLRLTMIEQTVLDNYLLGVTLLDERIGNLNTQIELVAKSEPFREKVAFLCCFQGIKTLSAMILLSEIRGFSRFVSPRQLMAYMGLVPSEYSSGAKQTRGPITKTGNTHARRTLVEIAHQYCHPPLVGYAVNKRRQGQPAHIVDLAKKAHRRLYQRFRHLHLERGMHRNKVVTAVARELVGFIWKAMCISELKQAA